MITNRPCLLTMGRIFLVIGIACALLSAESARATDVISPGPAYGGAVQVSRLYIYSFLDANPTYASEDFCAEVRRLLGEAFAQQGIPTEQLWFSETKQYAAIQRDPSGTTLGPSTSLIPADEVIDRNWKKKEGPFQGSHRLKIFAAQMMGNPGNYSLTVKWDVIDANSGYYEWSVYTVTPRLGKHMFPEDAKSAAKKLVGDVIAEMKARNVLLPIADAAAPTPQTTSP